MKKKKKIERRIIEGQEMLGIGWGIGGLCKGNEVEEIQIGLKKVDLLVIEMEVGMIIKERWIEKKM